MSSPFPTVVSIASSDNSGGAGIQMDLYAFNMLKVHGCNVITAVTAQNSREFKTLYPLPVEIIKDQLDTLIEDFEIKAIKLGLIGSPEILRFLGGQLKNIIGPAPSEKCHLVVDPVLSTTVGGKIDQNQELINIYKNEIFPITYILTPNIPEAEALLERSINTNSEDDRTSALKNLLESGPENILLKGGHASPEQGKVFDWLAEKNGKIHSFEKKYIEDVKIHGTGCMFSALIAAHTALGYLQPYQAAAGAESLLNDNIENTIPKGKSDLRYFNTSSYGSWQVVQAQVMNSLKTAKDELMRVLVPEMVAEVGMNFGYALPAARSVEDVCGLDARIIRTNEGVQSTGGLSFGASGHVARIILSAMEFDLRYRSAVNVRYSDKLIDKLKNMDLSIGTFDRSNEPADAKTMDWGTRQAIQQAGQVPDIIYDKGGIGKEPMIRILGKNPQEIVDIKKLIIDRVY